MTYGGGGGPAEARGAGEARGRTPGRACNFQVEGGVATVAAYTRVSLSQTHNR